MALDRQNIRPSRDVPVLGGRSNSRRCTCLGTDLSRRVAPAVGPLTAGNQATGCTSGHTVSHPGGPLRHKGIPMTLTFAAPETGRTAGDAVEGFPAPNVSTRGDQQATGHFSEKPRCLYLI